MADLDQPILTIRTAAGEEWTRVESYSLQSNWLQPTDTWSVTVYDDENPRRLRDLFRPLQPVSLLIHGQEQILGRVDSISGDGSGSLQIEGRDYLADVVDSNVDPTLKVTENQNLQTVILSALKPFGIDRTFGDFNGARKILTGFNPFVGEPQRDFRKAQLSEFKPNWGEGCFDYVNRVAARHGFTVQRVFDLRTVAIVEPEYRQTPIGTVNNPGNALGIRCTRDYSGVPTVTFTTGRKNSKGEKSRGILSSFPTFGPGSPSEVGNNDEVRRIITADNGESMVVTKRVKEFAPKSENAPLYRPMYYQDKDSRNQEQIDRGARRMIAEKLKDTLRYECTVRGHKDPDTGAIYSVDTILNVRDEIEGVEEPMWCIGRTLQNSGRGPETRLQLIRVGTLVL